MKISCLCGLILCSSVAQGAAFRAGELVYQIYPRAFYDGSSQADGKGDLKGIEAKLDYLSELGVDQILLMPIHDAQDPIGYIPRDFFSITADYGGPEDLRSLIQAAHQRDIRIILDSPINHVADDSFWVRQAMRKSCDPWDPGYRPNDPNLRYCQYFFQVGNPWSESPYKLWHKPWDWDRTEVKDVWHRIYGFNPAYHRDAYAYSSFSPNMIDLKYYDPQAKRWNEDLITDIKRSMKSWIDLGIDGLRIDAAKHLVEGEGRNDQPAEIHNLQLLARLRDYQQSLKPGSSFIGEIWDSYPVMNQYLQAGAIDSFFDFGFMGSLRESIKAGTAQSFRGNLAYLEAQGASIRIDQQIVTIGNHDVSRVMTEFQGDTAKVEQAFFALLSSPFPALIFYGDEIGMEGLVKRPTASDPREFLETIFAFPWRGNHPTYGFPGQNPPAVGVARNASTYNLEKQRAEADSLFARIQKLIALRKTMTSDGAAQIKVLPTQNDRIFAYSWPRLQGGCYLVFMGFDRQSSQSMPWPKLPEFCTTVEPESLWSKGATFNTTSVKLDPMGQLVLQL